MIKTFVRFCDFLFRCLSDYLKRFSAEREGFEPPVPFGTAVFKTAVIDHSTISPEGNLCSLPASLLKAIAKVYTFFGTAKY